MSAVFLKILCGLFSSSTSNIFLCRVLPWQMPEITGQVPALDLKQSFV